MRFLSLFSGYGGMDKGLEQAGLECVGQCEIDKDCLRVLEHHWPNVRRWTDVRDVGATDGGRLRRSVPLAGRQGDARCEPDERSADGGLSIDLICGGFPCQDVSVAGKRAGLDGARSGLWFEFHRIVRELRPKYVLVENVPGLLSSNEGRDFAVILDGLGEFGFAVSWAVLDSQHFGVPQRRRRVFIVAGPSVACTEAVLALAEGCGGHPQTSRTEREDVAGEAGGGVANPLGASIDRGAGGGGVRLDLDHTTYIPEVVGALSDGAHHGGGLNGQDAYTGRIFVDRAIAHALSSHAAGSVTEDGTGRGTPLVAVSQTLRAGAGAAKHAADWNNLITSASVRRLTPTECLRLQAMPDDWLDLDPPLSDGAKYRMAGNAVTASVATYIGKRMMAVERGKAAK